MSTNRREPDDAHARRGERGSQEPPPPTGATPASGVSRRSFISTLGASGAASALAGRLHAELATGMQDGADAPDVLGPDPVRVRLRVNGRELDLTLDPATTLLEALRVHANLIGTKEVCDRGSCGACTVLVDGRTVTACMMLALDAQGSSITTVEGLGDPESLSTLQEAFIRYDALQCGYCTPGLLVSCAALLQRTPKPTMDEIRTGLSGNLCRCGTYTNIFAAVLAASGQPVPQDAPVPGDGHAGGDA